MKHKLIRFSSIAACVSFLTVFFGAAIINTPSTEAISAMDFKAGNIIDDGVFYNKNTMTIDEIKAFLNKYQPACDTWGTGAVGSGRYINGKAVPANTTRAEYAKQMRKAGNTRYHEPPYVCLQNYYENPTTHETLYDTKNVWKSGMISAARIIYNAAQKYGINPQVLLVMLKKESYVWGDNWPLKYEYNTVMGYACPDSAPCNTKYYGFYNQVEMAAWQLNYYKSHINSYNYHPYATNSILYSPTTSCGRKSVYIENIATTSLYIYTPYTPNDAALKNYPGTATCGSYGNRNFYMYFKEWFGSTHGSSIVAETIPESSYLITTKDGSKKLVPESTNKANGVKIVARETSDNAMAYYSFTKQSDGSYMIKNDYSGFALGLSESSAIVGAKIQESTTAQSWIIYGDNTGGYYIGIKSKPYYIMSVDSNNNLVLDIYGSSTSNPLKLTPNSTGKIEDGIYTITSALQSNYVLDLEGNSTKNDANIRMWTSNSSKGQEFSVQYDVSSGFYTILPSYSGRSLDIVSGKMKDGTNILQYDKNTSCAQRYAIIKNNSGNYTIQASCNMNYAFDVADGKIANGTNVRIWTNSGSKGQQWQFKKKVAEPEKPAETNTSTPSTDTKTNTETAPAQTTKPTTTPAPEKNNYVKNGTYYINSALKKRFVIDAAGGKTAKGTNIQVYSRNDTASQRFKIVYSEKRNAYKMTNVKSSLDLDLKSGLAKNDSNIDLWLPNGSCAQYWRLIKTKRGNYNLQSTCNGKYYIDIVGGKTKNSTNVILWIRNGALSQEWKFEK